MSIIKLFIVYFKIGMLAFGGGYTMLPLLEREFVEKHKCLTEGEIMDYFALSQSIPGLIAINMATFLGHRLRGTKGAIAAALGMMLPSIIIITIIAIFFQDFAEIPWVQSVFSGLTIAIIVLIIQVLWKMAKRNITDWITFGIFLAVFVVYLLTGLNPAFFVLFGATAGLLLAGRTPS